MISIIRLVYLLALANRPDFSFDNTVISYWTCVEVSFAIICACMMTLKPLLTRLFPKLLEERPLPSDPEQLAAHSIGGRPMRIVARRSEVGPPNRASWIGLPDDAAILEEGEAGVTMGDMRARLVDAKAIPAQVHIRGKASLDVSTGSSISSTQASTPGTQVKSLS